MNYQPHEFQKVFHKSTARFRLLYGGRQSGKTLGGTIEDCWYMDHRKTLCCNELVKGKNPVCPKCKKGAQTRSIDGCVVAPTYQDLNDVNVSLVLDLIPHSMVKSWNKMEMRLTLTNGNTALFRSADNPDKLLRGREFDWIHLDEPRDYKQGKQAWETLYPTLIIRNGRAWATTTTNGKDWVYDVFYKDAMHYYEPENQLSVKPQPVRHRINEVGNEDFAVFHFRSIDNVGRITEEEIERARRTMTKRRFRQELFATIEQFKGLVYPDFDERLHVIEPRELNTDDLWFVGYDDAYPGTVAALLVAEDIDHNLYVVDELYKQRIVLQDTADKIKKMVGDRKVSIYVADPSISKETRTADMQGTTVQDQFFEAGIPFTLADNTVRPGINRVTQYLLGTSQEDTPGLYVFNNCKNLIKEFGRYVWEEQRSEDSGVDVKPKKAFDHALDALRYIIMSRPEFFERVARDEYGREVKEEGVIEFTDETESNLYDIL